jgi:hypothetical protein
MHRVRNSGIIQRAGGNEDTWFADLKAMDTPENRDKAPKGTVDDWATASLLTARQVYQNPTTGLRIKPGAKLANAYQEAHGSVVRLRLYQAGTRLAIVINDALGGK